MSSLAEFLDLIVDRIEPVSATASRFRFVRADGAPLPPFSPGAHVSVFIDTGERLLRNAYTLTGPVGDGLGYSITVQREAQGKGGSRRLHDALKPGDPVRLRAPLNYFPVNHRARRHLFIAGGIGITPFVTMIPAVAAAGADFALHYAFRDADHAPYAMDLAHDYGQRVHLWNGAEGRRIDIAGLLVDQPAGTQLYVCGPLRLIDAVEAAAARIGWPKSRIQCERFCGPSDGAPFAARIASTGQVIRVGAHQSLLDALEENGHPVDYMCRIGFCGRCRLGARPGQGRIQHNDQALDEDERRRGDCIIPCVSRYEGDGLTLDL